MKWIKYIYAVCEKADIEPSPGHKLEQWVKDAGFINVRHRIVKVPNGMWPRDPKFKEIGIWNHTHLMMGLEGLLMRPLTTFLGWSPEEVQVFLIGLRKDLTSPNIHAYMRL